MLSMEALKEYGVKTNEGLARCCNMEAFYCPTAEEAVKKVLRLSLRF